MPRPAGSINIEYYLVNENGQPISTAGDSVVSWEARQVLSNKQYINPQTDSAFLKPGTYEVTADPTYGSVYIYEPKSGGTGGNPTAASPVNVVISDDTKTVYFGYRKETQVNVTIRYFIQNEEDANYTEVPGSTANVSTIKDQLTIGATSIGFDINKMKEWQTGLADPVLYKGCLLYTSRCV